MVTSKIDSLYAPSELIRKALARFVAGEAPIPGMFFTLAFSYSLKKAPLI